MPRFYKPGERKGNRFYVVRGTIDGREYEIATKSRNKAGAEAHWDNFKSDIRAGRRGGGSGEPPTFREVAETYKAARRPGRNDHRYIEKLCKVYLKSRKARFGDLFVDAVRPSDIAAAANALHPASKNETKNRQVYTPAAAILHFAHDDGLRDYLVVKKLPEQKPENRRPRYGEPSALIEAATGEERRFLIFLFYQGWRLGEVLVLDWDWVDLHRNKVKALIGKARTWKLLDLHPKVREALLEVPRHRRKGRVFSYRNRWSVYRALRPLRDKLASAFTPHMARHDFASRHREQGRDGLDLLDLSTWTSERSTGRYRAGGKGHIKQAVQDYELEPAQKSGDNPGKLAKKA